MSAISRFGKTPASVQTSRHGSLPVRHAGVATLLGPCLLAVLALLFAAAPALAVRGHVFSTSFGSKGSGDGQLEDPQAVAVNEANGEVYVLDQGNGRVEYFSSAGAYVGQFDGGGAPSGAFSFGGELESDGIAVDNDPSSPSFGDVYVADAGHKVIDKFSSTGAYVNQLTGFTQPPCGGVCGVGVDASGRLWAGTIAGAVEYSNAVANVLLGFTEAKLPSTNTFNTTGFAVDSRDDLYAHSRSGPIFESYPFGPLGELLPHAQSVNGGVDVEPSTGLATELSTNDVYVDNISSVARFGPSASGESPEIERLGVPGMTGSGVGVSAKEERVYVADSKAGLIDLFVREEPGPPSVQEESVSDVSGNSATFEAQLDPRGTGSEYRFEYGPCPSIAACATSAYGQSAPVPDAFFGSDFEAHAVSVHVQDLLAGSVYHYRVVVHNEHDPPGTVVEGVERTFTTQTAGALGLADGRQWELVSPPDKHGALIEAIRVQGVIQASAAGSAISYFADAPTESGVPGYSSAVQVLSTRGGGGWRSRDMALPHETFVRPSIGEGFEYRFFSEDLSLAVVQPFGSFVASIAPQASEQTPLLASDYLNGDVNDWCASGCYRPLVTRANDTAEPFEPFGEEGLCPAAQVVCGPEFLTGTPDLAHVVLRSRFSLTSTPAPTGGLYEWGGGRLALVSVLPEGEGAGAASLPILGQGGEQGARFAISNDGSRVFWGASGHLYVRDLALGRSLRLDSLQAGASGEGSVGPEFQLASSDGRKVFFTDTQRLTGDSGAKTGHRDLYECEIVVVAGGLECRLTDLTPLSGGQPADVQGAVLGASEDGSWVYFAADSVLENNGAPVAGAVHGTCDESSSLPGAVCDLYVRHDGVTSLVAVLSGEDSPDWAHEAEVQELPSLPARVSPDGRWLAFMSRQQLTSYDNRDVVSGKPDEEVFLYDGEPGPGAPALVCASCNPSGARPRGAKYVNDSLVGGHQVWGDSAWLAASVPGWTPYKSGKARYQPRYLSDSGRLFFNAHDALVAQAQNGTWDVYEYEPVGVPAGGHGCTAQSATFSERSDGCVGLISSSAASRESAFVDASESGQDVFFLTTAKLSPQDFDDAVDVYDAHECTEASPCLPTPAAQPPPCETEASCRAAPSPQPSIFGAPASATFSGAGNVLSPPAGSAVKAKAKPLTRAQKLAAALRACGKKRDKGKRVACERAARKRYAVKASRKANTNGRGGR